MANIVSIVKEAGAPRHGEARHVASPIRKVRKQPRSGIPNAMLIGAMAVLLVAIGYARGRDGAGYAAPLFWAGQLLLFAYVFYRVLKPATAPHDREFLVLVYAFAQSLLRWAYSPHMFTFSDELQHSRSLDNVLTTNHLFDVNYNLPISPRYPGLQSVTAELVQVSSMGPFLAGVIVSGIAHVLVAGCILLLFREISRSSRLACIGVVLYLLNPHASYFDTAFIYETVALPFSVLAILFAVRFATRPSGHSTNFYGLLVSLSVVVVSHHVSAIATVVLLATIAGVTAVFRDSRKLALPFAACAGVATLLIACWILSVAPITLEYLGRPAELFWVSLERLRQFQGSIDLPGPPTPSFDRALAPISVLVMLGLIAASVCLARNRPPLEKCFGWIALGSYAMVVGMRAVVTNGAELAGRMLTFTALFTALAAGSMLWRMASATWRRPSFVAARSHLATAMAIGFVLLLGSIVTSLPPFWGRIPGEFSIEGNPGGVDNVGVSRAEWAADHLKPGSRFFGDITSLTLLSTIAQLDPVDDPATLYYTERLTPENAAHIRSHSAIYVDVDLRMAHDVPMSGKYFPQDVLSAKERTPIEIAKLVKFDDIRGVSRIYDSGYGRVYDLRGGRESPYAN